MERKDQDLWELAEARVGFKRHLTSYIIVNIAVWSLWYFIGNMGVNYVDLFFPWPIWMTFGWGIGIVFHFLGVYVNNSYNAVDREYEKLKKKNNM
ncbi:2TM domain-containing protein [Marivirga salinarum]|uniref:2TM domain-containing protein n=1 Tax=Marivirga salinarum TaxID=3059078 RepID=UPI00355B897C